MLILRPRLARVEVGCGGGADFNRVHGRSGAVWMREYFDRYMRNDDHLWTTIDYVENNPVAARLAAAAADWPWSSARLRLNYRS